VTVEVSTAISDARYSSADFIDKLQKMFSLAFAHSFLLPSVPFLQSSLAKTFHFSSRWICGTAAVRRTDFSEIAFCLEDPMAIGAHQARRQARVSPLYPYFFFSQSGG